ncbi:MAG: PA14 domain-containing protein [Panacagrimonas sp.]
MLARLFASSGKPFVVAIAAMSLAFGAAAMFQPEVLTGFKGQIAKRVSGLGSGARANAAPVQTAAVAAATPSEPIPADADVNGMWSSVKEWPLIPIHTVLLPDGRVLAYGARRGQAQQSGLFDYDIWMPSRGFGADSHLTLRNDTAVDLFCSAQLVLPQQGAGVVIVGGDTWLPDDPANPEGTGDDDNYGNDATTVFSYADNSLTRTQNLQRKRYYATATTLLNGEIYIQGGRGRGGPSVNGLSRPEVRSVDGAYRELPGIFTGIRDTTPRDPGYDYYYPRNFVAPDGRIFGFDIAGKMYYVDPSGDGTLTPAGVLPFPGRTFNEQDRPIGAGRDATAVMYQPGRILVFGGNEPLTRIVDITSGAPVITPTNPISSARNSVFGTILPDGRVLATGGSAVYNELVGVNNAAEIWDPVTERWTVGSSGAMPRLYHSTALLMPDATVLVGGGGAVGPVANLNAEIYYPAYLFKASGGLANRPNITSAPSTLRVGRSFSMDISHNRRIEKLTLVKTGAATHNFNMDQRFVSLTFLQNGGDLTVQMTSRASDTPPGYYMLFALDDLGVPSTARMVFINVATTDGQAPSIVNPGNQSTEPGTAVNLQIEASDPDNDDLRYTASGLPPGLSLNAGNGRITGSPDTVGSYNVSVSASDGELTASTQFSWDVVESTPVVFDQFPSLAPGLAGTSLSLSARATGNSVRYQWNFGDGTPTSSFSNSGQINHEFEGPGAYFVTVTAMSAGGSTASHTFLQLVHLPLTNRPPGASSNIAYERRPGRTSRVWVINQDNDSVTAFDAATLGNPVEIAVGRDPRSIAIAEDGRVWVTNKTSFTISIIDPVQMTVVRTVRLPRASQPFGIVMPPAGPRAYVVLAATGQVVQLNTRTYRILATASVGPNPRQVSVSADNATLYVSRFITPPQPGEDTDTVRTTSGGRPTGGQLVRLRSADLGIIDTITLAHSSLPDGENQGSGVPNYLGAAALSPDGTQAWVPSKQDNVRRGLLRDGNPLNFQNTVRAITSRINLATAREDLSARFDLDNSGVASAAAFDPLGVFLFVALETSREVAVLDAHRRNELFRFRVGRAPDGLVLAPDGGTIYVNNFMDRTVSAFSLSPLLSDGELRVQSVATRGAVVSERLTPQVLLGKKLFYDALDPRLAQDAYVSCASCHNDGGQDGRVWDFTGFGEGLRNTIALTGRAGGQGFLHWSNNFDEVQDFEMQIRALSGGSGLMPDAQLLEGTRQQPLGTPKAGVSPDLDALAAYVQSLRLFARSPFRSGPDLSSAAVEGRGLFVSKGCASCHAGEAFTGSGANTLVDIGTVKPASGQRSGQPLTGIDVPTLRDVWATAPYLHDGSAATLEAAMQAHVDIEEFSAPQLASLKAYLNEIGSEEVTAPPPAPGTGTGLRGIYFNNETLTAPAVLARTEVVDFRFPGSPGPGVSADGFSVRWIGDLRPAVTGSYRFRTVSNDGVRLRVNGQLLINNWVAHPAPVTDTSATINLEAGQTYPILMQFFEHDGPAEARLSWLRPGTRTWETVPRDRLSP